jgi:hypothetical protein
MVSALLILPLLSALAGCSSSSVDVKITQDQPKDDRGLDGLTPLERGKVRRQVLNDTQKALDVWIKGDTKAYDRAFTKALLKEYEVQLAKLKSNNKEKIRIHTESKLEVTELTKEEAGLKYTFTDGSYFVNAKTKKVITPPSNKSSEIAITVKKENGLWRINAMIGNGEQTL